MLGIFWTIHSAASESISGLDSGKVLRKKVYHYVRVIQNGGGGGKKKNGHKDIKR